jgi:K+ transporter
MEWWVYLILALIIIFTIMLWNMNNSLTYQRLRKARARWNAADQDFKDKAKARAKQDLQYLRGDIESVWDQITDIFDGDD